MLRQSSKKGENLSTYSCHTEQQWAASYTVKRLVIVTRHKQSYGSCIAFDRVLQKRLFQKLEHLGVRGHLLSCIRALLTSLRAVVNGVLQSSFFGPILFLKYITGLSLLHIKPKHISDAADWNLYANTITDSDNAINELNLLPDLIVTPSSASRTVWILFDSIRVSDVASARLAVILYARSQFVFLMIT